MHFKKCLLDPSNHSECIQLTLHTRVAVALSLCELLLNKDSVKSECRAVTAAQTLELTILEHTLNALLDHCLTSFNVRLCSCLLISFTHFIATKTSEICYLSSCLSTCLAPEDLIMMETLLQNSLLS